MSISTMAENSALRLGGPSLVELAAQGAAKAASDSGTNVDIPAATRIGMLAARNTEGVLPKITAAASAAATAADQQHGSANVDVPAATDSGIRAATEATSTGITSSSVLSQLVSFIPTETVALWLAVQTALSALAAPSGMPVCDADFKPRWIWFGILLIATAALTIGLSYRQQKNKGEANFQLPILETIITLLAFTVWALSLTNSPWKTSVLSPCRFGGQCCFWAER